MNSRLLRLVCGALCGLAVVSFTAPDATAGPKVKKKSNTSLSTKKNDIEKIKASKNPNDLSVEKNKKNKKQKNSKKDASAESSKSAFTEQKSRENEAAQRMYNNTRPAKTSIRFQDKNGKFYTELYFFKCLEETSTHYATGQSQEAPDMHAAWFHLVEEVGPAQAARIWREQMSFISDALRRLSELKDAGFLGKKVRDVSLGSHTLFDTAPLTQVRQFPIDQIINRLESLYNASKAVIQEHPDDFRNPASIGWIRVDIVKDKKDPYTLAFLFVPDFWKPNIMKVFSSFEKRKNTQKPVLTGIPTGTFNLADAKMCLDAFEYSINQLKNSSAKNVDIVDGSQQNERYNKNKIEFEATKSALLPILQSLSQQAKSAINNK